MKLEELFKKIKRIEITTNKIVNEVLVGKYQSVFKGRGIEFEEVREYQEGDDIRTIDWNVTARIGKPFVKRFVEERQLTVMLLVDASSSNIFGTVEQMKSELAAEVCAVLAFSAIKSNDRVGLIIFTNQIEKYIPPRKGSEHVLRIVREILYFNTQNSQTDIKSALEFLNRVQPRKSVVFLISDFFSTDYEKALKLTSKRHDLIAISINDPREMKLPPIGIIELEDSETGEIILIDTYDTNLLYRFEKQTEDFKRKREDLFKNMGIDHIQLQTGQPYLKPLILFFKNRALRMRM